jgi:hypothetical protein
VHLWKRDVVAKNPRCRPAYAIRELDATAHLTPLHDQLMSERRILCLKSALRLERRGEQAQEEAEQSDHHS